MSFYTLLVVLFVSVKCLEFLIDRSPRFKSHPWQDGWQQRLAERAKEVEPVLKAKEESARAYRAQIKAAIPKEKKDAQYMPEELKKHLGLV